MPTFPKGNTSDRDLLYRLIISQLYYDGHQTIAANLTNIIKPTPSCPPSDRLNHIVSLGLVVEKEQNPTETESFTHSVAPGNGIDLEFESDVQSVSPDASQYETCYVTAHKGPCRTAAFHPNGQLIATGSEDASIKILDVDRMLSKSATPADIIAMETPQQLMENHPVIRTLYDHTEEVTCLAFHPTAQVLISGGKDCTVKLYDYSKPSVKKAFKSIHETDTIRAVNFHPTGDYALVGTDHQVARLYDTRTLQCFVGANPKEQHTAAVNDMCYSNNGVYYVTCSDDGDIKLWDTVSNRCINTFPKAHSGKSVSSVIFSRNSKYVLSAGKDALVKLWELSMARCLIAYTGAGASESPENRVPAVFNHTEDYVLYPDEGSVSLCCWDSRNAERQKLLALGHNSLVRTLVHSPTGPSFVSCSDDHRARFWYRRAETD